MNNNIFRHIEYLLLSHDCVIVPGLGAFIAVVRPAAIDYDNWVILPPSRSLVFNQAVSSDDGLLANSYVRKYGVSFEEARQLVVREVSLMKDSLSANKELGAGNLGNLKLGEEDNLIFTPSEGIADLNRRMGFLTVNTTKVKSQSHPDIAVDEESLKDSNSYESRSFRIGKNLFKVAAVFAVLAAVAVAFILNPIPSDNREQRASVVPVDAIIQHHDNREVVAETPCPDKNISTPENFEQIESEEPVHSSAHYLVIATFSSDKEAEKYVANNSTDATPLTIVKSRRMSRVAIAESDNLDELRKKLNSRQILSQYPGAWIWTAK